MGFSLLTDASRALLEVSSLLILAQNKIRTTCLPLIDNYNSITSVLHVKITFLSTGGSWWSSPSSHIVNELPGSQIPRKGTEN